MDLPHGISSIDELRDDQAGGSNSGQEEEGEQVMNFAKDHAVFKTVKSFFYATSWFFWNIRFQRKQLSITGFFGSSSLHTGMT